MLGTSTALLRMWHICSVIALLRVTYGQIFQACNNRLQQQFYPDRHGNKSEQCLVLDNQTMMETCNLSREQRTLQWAHVFVSLAGSTQVRGQVQPAYMVSVRELMLLIDDHVENASSVVDDRILWLSNETITCWQSDLLYNDQCRICLSFIQKLLLTSSKLYEHFTKTVIERMDCLHTWNSSSADESTVDSTQLSSLPSDHFQRQFSPNSTCQDCQLWYMRWLLVASQDEDERRIWQKKPCLAWCYYAELACPFLGTSRETDYAGLPAFRCQDPQITQTEADSSDEMNTEYEQMNTCDCIHPCDLLNMTTASAPSAVTSYIIDKLNCTRHLAERDICSATIHKDRTRKRRSESVDSASLSLSPADKSRAPVVNVGRKPPWPSFYIMCCCWCWWCLVTATSISTTHTITTCL